jgi:putative ABC transport system permease protein
MRSGTTADACSHLLRPTDHGYGDSMASGSAHLALRNIFRHKGRSLLTLGVIIAGVTAIVLTGGFVEDVFVQLRESTIHSQLGHVQIYRAGYSRYGTQSPFKYLIDDPGAIADLARQIPDVDASMKRLAFTGMVNNGRTDVAILGEGMEPEKEAILGSTITITQGRQLTNKDAFGILLGEGVAHVTKLKPGDPATLLVSTVEGALNSLEFEVVGVFRSVSRDYDARAVRIPLSAAQELLAVRAVNAVVVSLKTTESTDRVALHFRDNLDGSRFEVKAWYELADFYEKTVALYRRQFAVLEAIILLAVALSVANSVNMSIFERIGEFGTLMALGSRSGDVFRLVLVENALLGLLGGLLGAILGVALAWAISAIGIPMPPPPNSNSGYTAIIRVEALTVTSAILIGFIATSLAALLPARRVSRIAVVTALRHN